MKAADCWGQAMESPGTGARRETWRRLFAETQKREMQKREMQKREMRKIANAQSI